ncbi:HAMP domain-containing protein [bacterium]|nr:HAMP domain-containing protein [bacterium]
MKTLRIGNKLVLGFTCCILLSAVIGGVAIINLVRISHDIKQIKIAANIEKVILECRRQEKNILLLGPHSKSTLSEQEEKTYLEKLNHSLLSLRSLLDMPKSQDMSAEINIFNTYIGWLDNIVAAFAERKAIIEKLVINFEKLHRQRHLREHLPTKTLQRQALLNHELFYHGCEYLDLIKTKVNTLKNITKDQAVIKLVDEYLALFDKFVKNSENINTNILNMRKNGRKIQTAAIRLETIAEKKIAVTHSQTIAIVWTTFLAVVILAGIICVLLARNITRPVSKLAAATTIIAQGNLSQRVEISSHDEIGQLARAFNNMTADLQKTTVSKNYVDDIIGSMLDALLVVDVDGNIRAVNEATCRVLGYSEAELLGKPVREIFTEESFYTGFQLNELLKTGYVKNRELICLSQSGARISMLFSGAVIRDSQGQINGIVGVGKDMRELISLQEKLARHEKLAVMGEFAGIIGHEFKNQLGIMRVSVYFLKMKSSPKDKTQMKHLNILEKQIIATNRMIENISTFSRTRKPEFKSIDINQIISASMEQVSIPEEIVIVNHTDENLPSIPGDEIQLGRVFVNMFLNAIQAMAGKGHLSITVVRENKFVHVKIADTGSGISAENKAKIFEPFYSTKSTGTGLGLASSRYIVEAHGGSIAVESEKGKGTVMSVKLPIKPETA